MSAVKTKNNKKFPKSSEDSSSAKKIMKKKKANHNLPKKNKDLIVKNAVVMKKSDARNDNNKVLQEKKPHTDIKKTKKSKGQNKQPKIKKNKTSKSDVNINEDDDMEYINPTWKLGEDTESDNPVNNESDLNTSESDIDEELSRQDIEKLLSDSGEDEELDSNDSIPNDTCDEKDSLLSIVVKRLEILSKSCIYVAPIPLNTDLALLKSLSSKCNYVRVPVNEKTKTPRSFAFLHFGDSKIAESEVKKISGRVFGGKVLRASVSKLPEFNQSNPIDEKKLLVCGLSPQITIDDMKSLVPSADHINFNLSKSGQNYGWCLLSFVDASVALENFNTLHGHELKGSKFDVNFKLNPPVLSEKPKKNILSHTLMNKKIKPEEPVMQEPCEEISSDINRAAIVRKRQMGSNKVIVEPLKNCESSQEDNDDESTGSAEASELSSDDDVFIMKKEKSALSSISKIIADQKNMTDTDSEDNYEDEEESGASDIDDSDEGSSDKEAASPDDSDEESNDESESDKRILEVMQLKETPTVKGKKISKEQRQEKAVKRQLDEVMNSFKKAKRAKRVGKKRK